MTWQRTKELEMSLQQMLGVGTFDSPTMVEARCRWTDWCAREPQLAVVGDLMDLAEWTQRRDPRTNDVLRALARLGSPTGSNDRLATAVLCWVLLRGATAIARRLSDLTPAIDELTVSHLWTNAREHDWTKPVKVAPAILAATRRGVQAELGVGEGAKRVDRTWLHATSIEPTSQFWERVNPGAPDNPTAFELSAVFDQALGMGAITIDDRDLLFELAAATDELAAAGVSIRAGRGNAGLLNNAASERVGQLRGISALHVRRRAKSIIVRVRHSASVGAEAVSTTPASA